MPFANSFKDLARKATPACSSSSQFVQVLQLLKAELEAASLPFFCYLDGSSKDRMAQVDRFQEDESVPVFLISLNAEMGTGQNLDRSGRRRALRPWWNPAAEAQAGRPGPPHRSGQTSHRLQADHLGNGGGTGARPPARQTQTARASLRAKIGSRQPRARRRGFTGVDLEEVGLTPPNSRCPQDLKAKREKSVGNEKRALRNKRPTRTRMPHAFVFFLSP